MDVTVRRNAFGRQTRSFEAPVDLCLTPEANETFHGIFIRAPWVETIGSGVEVIARYDGHIVGVRQDHMIGVAFHPELGDDTRLHATSSSGQASRPVGRRRRWDACGSPQKPLQNRHS